MKGLNLDPKTDGKKFTRGSLGEKSLRDITLLIDRESVNAEYFVGGLATFPEGMTAPAHIHPDAEEVNIVLEGEGTFITPEGEYPVKTGDFQFIPKGVEHSHSNTGKGPFTIVWLYSPPTDSAPR